MNRLAMFLAGVGLALASPAAAQVIATTNFPETPDYPTRQFSVSLTAGASVQFETRNCTAAPDISFYADTVMALRASSAAQGTAPVAGADGCGAEFERSCFTTTIPTTASYTLLVWAANSLTHGTCEVRRNVNGTGWISMGTVTIGGDTFTTGHIPSGTTAVRIETMHEPGTATWHNLLIVPPGQPIWSVRYYASANSARTTGAAAIDIANATTAGMIGYPRYTIAPTLSGTVGSTSVVLNLRTASLDYDQDGLPLALEASLGTCDRPTQALLASGFSCWDVGTRGESVCADYPSFPTTQARVICQSALRDTDLDGYRDDLETLGYAGFRLRQWGANPVHADAYFEMDTYDQDPSSTGTCQGFTPETLAGPVTRGDLSQLGSAENPDNLATRSPNFFDTISAIFSAHPAEYNPDGLPGVSLHFDVGINPPDRMDTRYGSWGGGGTCVPQRTNPDTGAFELCEYLSIHGDNETACPPLTSLPVAHAISRRWIFSWGIDGPYGNSGGQEANGPMGTNDTAGWAHELGHLGFLGHAGPRGSLLEVAVSGRGPGSIRVNETGNIRPNYLTRVNYGFSYVHGIDGSSSTTEGAADFVRHAFSSGELRVFNYHEMDEISPFDNHLLNNDMWQLEWYYPGATDPYPEAVARVVDGATGADVDWNRDTLFAGPRRVAGDPTNQFMARAEARPRTISTYAPASTRRHRLSPNGAGVVGDALVLSSADCLYGSTTGCRARLYGEVEGHCSLNPVLPFTACPGGGVAQTGECGPYPGCFPHGMPLDITPPDIAINSMAIAQIDASYGTGIAMVLVTSTNQIRIGSGDLATGSPPIYIGFASPPLFSSLAVSTDPIMNDVGVAPIGGPSVLIAYADSSSRLRQIVANAETRTGTSSAMQSASGAAIYAASAPSLTTAFGVVYMAVSRFGTSSATRVVDVYRRESNLRWTLLGSTPSGFWVGPPGFAAVNEPFEAGPRFHVILRELTGGTLVDGSPAATARLWRSGILGAPLGDGSSLSPLRREVASSVAVVFDNRELLYGTSDLRAYWADHYVHDTTPGAAGGEELWHGLLLTPFAGIGDPTPLVDYNDYDAMQWGYCRGHVVFAAGNEPNDTLGGVIPTTYRTPTSVFERCGPQPRYPEIVASTGVPGGVVLETTLSPRDTGTPRYPSNFDGHYVCP